MKAFQSSGRKLRILLPYAFPDCDSLRLPRFSCYRLEPGRPVWRKINHHLADDADLVYVSPKRFALRSLVPGCVIDGRVLGVIFADSPDELISHLASPTSQCTQTQAQRSVLAQWEEGYLATGRNWLRMLRRRQDGTTGNWMANRIGGGTLCRRLAAGGRLCVYFGHGRPQGFSGYHGLYIPELLSTPLHLPVQTFLSFACQHLAQPFNTTCLGRELVAHRRVRAFWGSVQHVDTVANRQLAGLGAELIAEPHCKTVGDWLRRLDCRVREIDDPALRKVWGSYRLIGNPQTPI